jgi:hypothetical protein
VINPPNKSRNCNKIQYFEHSESCLLPEMENIGSRNYGKTPPVHDTTLELTEAEVNLLRKLRTLQGGDYEAQYFDNKPTPNKKSLIEKMGNPTPLYIP